MGKRKKREINYSRVDVMFFCCRFRIRKSFTINEPVLQAVWCSFVGGHGSGSRYE